MERKLYFSHMLMFILEENLGFIKNRGILLDIFKKVLKNRPICYIDPSELVSFYGQNLCMQKSNNKDNDNDINHYTQFMIKKLGDTISNKIISF